MSFTGNRICRFCGDYIDEKENGYDEVYFKEFGNCCSNCFIEKIEGLFDDVK